MICAGDVPGVETGVVGGPDHTGPLGTSVQLVVTLSVGNQPASELGRNQPEREILFSLELLHLTPDTRNLLKPELNHSPINSLTVEPWETSTVNKTLSIENIKFE